MPRVAKERRIKRKARLQRQRAIECALALLGSSGEFYDRLTRGLPGDMRHRWLRDAVAFRAEEASRVFMDDGVRYPDDD